MEVTGLTEDKMEIEEDATIHINDDDDNANEIIQIPDGEEDEVNRLTKWTSDEFIKFDEQKVTEAEVEKFEDNLEDNDEDDDVQIQDDSMDYLLEQEKTLLNMPSTNLIMTDIDKLRQEHVVSVYPVNVAATTLPDLLTNILTDTCEEVKMNFIRPKSSTERTWNGYLTLTFNSRKEAKLMAEKLKALGDDVNVCCDVTARKDFKSIGEWERDEKQSINWSDTLLWVSNIPESVTEDNLLEIFPDAIDAIFKSHRPSESKTRQAYVFFESAEIALAAANECYKRRDELKADNHQFFICKYVKPRHIFRDLLKLHERYLILRYIDRLQRAVLKHDVDDKYKIPEWCQKRLTRCKEIIEKDSSVRLEAGLVPPTTLELLGVKKLKGDAWTQVLVKYGIMPKSNVYRRYNDKRGNSRDQNGDRPQKKFNDKPEYKNNRFDNRSSQNQSNNNNQSSLLGEPPSLTSMPAIIPPLLLMQHNINLMGMMQNRMMGSQMGGKYGGGGMGSGRDMDKNKRNWNNSTDNVSSKVLRMDGRGSIHGQWP